MFACTVNSDKRCKPAFIRLTWQPKTIVTVVSARTALKDVKLPPSSYIWAFFSFLCILKRNGLHYYNTAYGFFAFAASLSLLLVPPRSQRVPTRKVQCASIVFLFVVVAFVGFEGYTFWKSWHSYRNSRCHPAYFRLHLRNNRIEKKATDIISEKNEGQCVITCILLAACINSYNVMVKGLSVKTKGRRCFMILLICELMSFDGANEPA